MSIKETREQITKDYRRLASIAKRTVRLTHKVRELQSEMAALASEKAEIEAKYEASSDE